MENQGNPRFYRGLAGGTENWVWYSIGVFAGTGKYWTLAMAAVLFGLYLIFINKAYKLERIEADLDRARKGGM